jgi:8-amino-7-oxononanoate synthase
MAKTDPYNAFCAQRAAQNRLRTLQSGLLARNGRILRDGRMLINFAGNDYLGLSQHKALAAASRAYVELFGAGVGASRLVTGEHPAFAEIEGKLAAAKRQESALVMASGYQTNFSALAALADPEVIGRPTTILADRLAHHSLLQGAQLSGARLMRFQHNDCGHLESLLRARTDKGEFCIVVTESVFGMDGDLADLNKISELTRQFEALLYVDEAHATGIFGVNGFGLCEDFAEGVDVAMGTFGKALGGFGAYLALPKVLREFLVNRCGGLIYSTGLPPAALGAIKAALELVPQLGAERAALLARAEALRERLRAAGFECGASASQIIPVVIGGESETLQLAARLEERGLLVAAIRPPTVPAGTSRLRISLSAAHSAADVEALAEVLIKFAPKIMD